MSQTVERRLISQPPDWWAAFERQASLEGMTMSQWVGEACKQRCLDAQGARAGLVPFVPTAQDVARSFSPRPGKGRAKDYLNQGKPPRPTKLPPPPPKETKP